MKKWEYALLVGLTFSILFAFAGIKVWDFDNRCDGIRDKVLRLHILANSDSDADQQLKLKVRDRLLCEGRKIFKDCKSRTEAEDTARVQSERLTAAAREVIKEEGFDYPVEIRVGEADFNIRNYDGITLPSGKYQAINVIIGNGEGHNWWCVMFPPLCLPAAEGVSADKDKLEDILDEGETDIVENHSKYEFKFKIVELWDRMTGKLQDR